MSSGNELNTDIEKEYIEPICKLSIGMLRIGAVLGNESRSLPLVSSQNIQDDFECWILLCKKMFFLGNKELFTNIWLVTKLFVVINKVLIEYFDEEDTLTNIVKLVLSK